MIFGLTPLGVLHTAVSIVAIVTGVWALIRYKQFSVYERLTQVYLIFTFVTALTALGIFQRGGFNIAHVLAILTLLAIVAGVVIEKTLMFGSLTRYAQALCYSTTLFFHAIPGFNESLSRLPPGKPITTGPDDPKFQVVATAILVVYLVLMAIQLVWLKRTASRPAPAIAR
jgi:uncharacterized membrane protein